MKGRTLVTGILGLALLLFSFPASAQPMADYGDAPDPAFPSLFASSGPRHTNVGDCFVGWTSTTEPNALIPDLDADDGAPLIFANYTPSGWTAWVYVPITIAQGAQAKPRYLNVLLDANSSGSWCDVPGEWIVRNFPLPTTYYYVHFPGQTVWYCIGGYTGVANYSGMHWLRVTLSDAMVTPDLPMMGWSGRVSSSFLIGETEDWLLQWYYNPPKPPDPPNPPPNTGIPPLPAPVPECNKTGAVYQSPPPTHVGHSGTFDIVVENSSVNHPMHIVEGPFATDVNGSPIDIGLESLESTYLNPGQKATSHGSWDFDNPGSNQAWCNWDVVVDPQGQYIVVANVGDYVDATGNQPTGGSFQESTPTKVPLTTRTGLVVLLVTLGLVSAYFIVRRRALASGK
ncbi:MAG: hypothetical protein NTX17_01110 [Candidatus Eisenbacteria bacterium]|nr:hypothetical protein [Candidatus Eisenbacteria bacterium]